VYRKGDANARSEVDPDGTATGRRSGA
jgi:hypothetical protein